MRHPQAVRRKQSIGAPRSKTVNGHAGKRSTFLGEKVANHSLKRSVNIPSGLSDCTENVLELESRLCHSFLAPSTSNASHPSRTANVLHDDSASAALYTPRGQCLSSCQWVRLSVQFDHDLRADFTGTSEKASTTDQMYVNLRLSERPCDHIVPAFVTSSVSTQRFNWRSAWADASSRSNLVCAHASFVNSVLVVLSGPR